MVNGFEFLQHKFKQSLKTVLFSSYATIKY